MDDLSSYYVDVDVHENKINAIQLGQKVELTFDAVPFENVYRNDFEFFDRWNGYE